MADVMDKVRALMGFAKVPQHYDKVYKDECILSFDTPFSEHGLYVNLKTWVSCGAAMLDVDLARHGGQGLYLLQKFTRVAKETPADDAAPTMLAIGVAGGFLDDKWEVVKQNHLVVVDASGHSTVPLPCNDLPMIVGNAVDAVIAHQGAKSMDESSRWQADQELRESKYAADLLQLPAEKMISPNPKDWVCQVSGDTQNLWLNLSDGHIGGGRRFWDGSGGSNGALDHFNEEQAKGNFFPLVVKLGTITPQGADVYSYAPDEDDMVKDPLLAQHLEHWGIDVMRMEKTDKTLAELEVDLNMNHDWGKICESGDRPLQRVRGPGLVGLKNLGNSCYMNSSVQLLVGLPECRQRYFDADLAIRSQAPADAAGDLVTQMAKLTNGMLGEQYAPPWEEGADEDDPKYLVAPQMFRTLIGKNHPEFSSGRQQDAAEFVQYFLEQLSRAERTALGSKLEAGNPFSAYFEFAIEERLAEVGGEGRVKYSRMQQNTLGVPVKLEDADNLAEVMEFKSQAESEEKDAKKPKTGSEPEEPKPIIHLARSLQRFAAPEDGITFRGGTVAKTTRMATMPRYLLVQVQRYYINEKWIPCKLDCKVPMPEALNLEHLRGSGVQPGEVEFPEDGGGAAAAAAPAAEPAGLTANEDIVAQLVSMDLNVNAAKRACIATGNSGAEAATAWFFEHMEDPDINDPLPEGGSPGGGAAAGAAADPEAVAMLAGMGFSDAHARGALKACGDGNMERAVEWLFSHADDLDAAVAALDDPAAGGGAAGGGGAAAREYEDGVGEYTLLGFVSHVGRHTETGHYVCHKRGADGSWVIFDDQRVALSESPPLDLGYLYLYRRNDAP